MPVHRQSGGELISLLDREDRAEICYWWRQVEKRHEEDWRCKLQANSGLGLIMCEGDNQQHNEARGIRSSSINCLVWFCDIFWDLRGTYCEEMNTYGDFDAIRNKDKIPRLTVPGQVKSSRHRSESGYTYHRWDFHFYFSTTEQEWRFSRKTWKCEFAFIHFIRKICSLWVCDIFLSLATAALPGLAFGHPWFTFPALSHTLTQFFKHLTPWI